MCLTFYIPIDPSVGMLLSLFPIHSGIHQTTPKCGIYGIIYQNTQIKHSFLKGSHPRVVQERLGHNTIATTLDIYSHTVPGMQKAAAERLDTLLPKAEEIANVGKMSAE